MQGGGGGGAGRREGRGVGVCVGREGRGAQLQTSAWPVITARSEYTGRVDFHIIAPT